MQTQAAEYSGYAGPPRLPASAHRRYRPTAHRRRPLRSLRGMEQWSEKAPDSLLIHQHHRDAGVARMNLNSEIEQVVLVLLLVIVLEKLRYLSVTLMQRNGARRFGPCFDAQSQQIEREHDF
jgi:hypothetical protein